LISFIERQRDLLCSFDVSAEQAVFDTRCPVLSEAYTGGKEPSLLQEPHTFAEWIQDYIGPDKDPLEPVSDIYFPILERAVDAVVLLPTVVSSSSSAAAEAEENPEDDSSDSDPFPIFGLLMLSIFWRDMIIDILPLGTEGILMVFENPCSPTFTYEIVSAYSAFPQKYNTLLPLLSRNLTILFDSDSLSLLRHAHRFLFPKDWPQRGLFRCGRFSQCAIQSHECVGVSLGY